MLRIHGMTATVKRLSEECRAVVTRAFTGRTAARTALAHGLPKEAIRGVLDGHDPRVSRADDVCRALGITFLLGGALDEFALPRPRTVSAPARSCTAKCIGPRRHSMRPPPKEQSMLSGSIIR